MSSSTSEPSAAGRDRAGMRSLAIASAIAGVALIVDQGTKALALAELTEGERIPLLGDLFGIQLAFNPGAALSLGSESTIIITGVTVVAVIGLVVAATRVRATTTAVALGLMLGGGLGNLIDRLVAPPSPGRGRVTDFLAYGDLFIGNLADVALVAGVAMLLLIGLTGWGRTRRAAPDEAGDVPKSSALSEAS